METPYVQTFGSFFRNGKYPLEANYIFESEESLKQWEQDNKKYLHEGLFKVVVTDDKQILYWYCNETFKPLLESDSLENLAMILKDFELHGQLRDILRDFKNSYESKLKSIQQELDLTQSGAGLNGDGSFDTLNMRNTTYLEGSNSIIEALKALDRELSNVVADAFIKDAYYDSGRESIIITFLTKQEKEKTVEINVANLIREWEPDNTHPSKVVELVREETYSGGPDKLSADVRLSSRKDNILEKDSNTLLVRGTSDNITHRGESLKTILDRFDSTTPVYENLTHALQHESKEGSIFIVQNDDDLGGKGFYIIDNNKPVRIAYTDDLSNVIGEEVSDPILEEIDTTGVDKIKEILVTGSEDLYIADSNLSLTDKAKNATFDAQWTAAGGTVITPGKVYECNGTDDLTYDEAIDIYGWHTNAFVADSSYRFVFYPQRALLPVVANNEKFITADRMFYFAKNLKVIKFRDTSGGELPYISLIRPIAAFMRCGALREIITPIRFEASPDSAFSDCAALEEVRIYKLRYNISFVSCPLLSLDSLRYMVANAANTSAITITVHADIYAKLTGDTTNAAAAALTADVLAQWQQVLADAMAKNISFATT